MAEQKQVLPFFQVLRRSSMEGTYQNPQFVCPKCGHTDNHIFWEPGQDILACTCRVCGFGRTQDPLDRAEG